MNRLQIIMVCEVDTEIEDRHSVVRNRNYRGGGTRPSDQKSSHLQKLEIEPWSH